MTANNINVTPSATVLNAPPQSVSVPIWNETPNYKYSENTFLVAAQNHIDKTYKSHYSGEIQTTEYIMSKATSLDFLKGSVFSYIDRFGKKEGFNVADLHKAVHFIAMMAFYGDKVKKD